MNYSNGTNTSYKRREDYKTRLPDLLQHYITWLSGAPYENQRPLYISNSILELLKTLFVLLLGISLCGASVIYEYSGWLMTYAIGTILITSAARNSVTTLAHHSSHLRVFVSKRANILLTEFITTIFISPSYTQYVISHNKGHHIFSTFATTRDDDATYIKNLKLTKSRTRIELWERLIWLFISPVFHLRSIKDRISLNLFHTSGIRQVASFSWIFTLIYLSFTGWAVEISLIYFIPVLILFNICHLLQVLSEHLWFIGGEQGKERNDKACWGRFLLPILPNKDAGLDEWLFWTTKIALANIVRITVLPGDLQQHDYHHKAGPRSDWTNSRYKRYEANIEEESYQHFWSLSAAIDYVFSYQVKRTLNHNKYIEV